MFTLGGLSGASRTRIAPADTQQTDTYYIVAHFHYVLFGGALFLDFFGWVRTSGGRRSSATLPQRASAASSTSGPCSIGFNLTFGPMHVLGLQGMPRRIAHLLAPPRASLSGI